VARRGVGAEQQQAVGQREVRVRRRRPVRAERAGVARDRARHAQARVRVDVVRAQEPLRELVDRVVVLGEQLAGDVERDRIGAVGVDDRAQPPGDVAQRLVPAGLDEPAVPAQQRRRGAVAGVHRRAQFGRLPARPSPVDRVARVAAHRRDAARAHVDLQAAAGAAVRAEGQLRGGHGDDHAVARFPEHDSCVSSA
jgi:hypothetical protein